MSQSSLQPGGKEGPAQRRDGGGSSGRKEARSKQRQDGQKNETFEHEHEMTSEAELL